MRQAGVSVVALQSIAAQSVQNTLAKPTSVGAAAAHGLKTPTLPFALVAGRASLHKPM